MDDQTARAAILDAYTAQQRAMVAADVEALDRLLDDDYVALHIGGRRQPKADWLADLTAGRFRYHSIEPAEVSVAVDDAAGTARLVGRAVIDVSIGGSRGTWRVESTVRYVLKSSGWTAVGSSSTTW